MSTCPYCGSNAASGHVTCGKPECASAHSQRNAGRGGATVGKCQVCGKPSGRGRYGYPTTDCGSEDCRAELKRRRKKRLEANLHPLNGGGMDWRPGLPGGERGRHR